MGGSDRTSSADRVPILKPPRRAPDHSEGMGFIRTAATATLLVVEAGLVALGVDLHYGMTAVYGDASGSVLQEFRAAFSPAGVSGIAVAVVLLVALIAAVVAPCGWTRLTAIVLPVLMVLGMLAVTPAALREKAGECSGRAQCLWSAEATPGQGAGWVR